MFVSLARLCVVYVVKEVASFPGGGGLCQLMGVARKRTRVRRLFELQTSQEDSETANICCI